MDLIVLDFQKEFDMVTYERLLLKVKALGIGRQIANCISHALLTGNSGLLLIVNVLNSPMLVSDCPGLSSVAYAFCNIYKRY